MRYIGRLSDTIWCAVRPLLLTLLPHAAFAFGGYMYTTIDVCSDNGSSWYRRCSRRGGLMRRSRSYEVHRSALRHHMVCSKALIAHIAPSRRICVWRVYVYDD